MQRAEASYGTDLHAARTRDQTQLNDLRRQINTRTRAAATTTAQRDALTTEYQLRAALPPAQARTENTQRTIWIAKQAVAAATHARDEQHRAHTPARDHPYHDHSRDHGQDHGWGLGL